MRREPLAQLSVNCFDISLADDIEIRWHCPARRIEEAPMHRVWIGASNEAKRRDVMRWNHPRVAGVELPGPSMACQLRGNLVDALGDDQHWSIGGLRQKVPHGAVETSRQQDPLAVLRNKGEGPVKVQNFAQVTSEQPAPSFRFVDRPQPLGPF